MTWRSQQFRLKAEQDGLDPASIDASIEITERFRAQSPNLVPILTLRHLSVLSGVSYNYLREIIERGRDPYKLFRSNKKPSASGEERYRIICVPEDRLLKLQRWIDHFILDHLEADEASFGFSKGSRIRDAAALHCGASWLIKLDIESFFESVTELQVFRIFHKAGYEPLVSLELARLCTRYRKDKGFRGMKWRAHPKHTTIPEYNVPWLGYLPQGAPTSPKLSNIALADFDQNVRAIARQHGLTYTRYADDLTLSTRNDFNRSQASKVIGKVYGQMRSRGFSPQMTKTSVVPPGARKIVLGLGVNSDEPKLTRKFKNMLRLHIHYLTNPNYGPAIHAKHQGNATIHGIRNHVQGLLAFAKGIEPEFSERLNQEFQTVDWP